MSDDHDSLETVIGRFLELAESGRLVDTAEFVARHPRHREELLSFIADHRAMGAAVGGSANASPAAARPVPGDARYLITGEIARGGMGAVLRAVDRQFARSVALKVLREDRDDELLHRRFLFEAQVTGWLQHPGIPPVHDQGRLPDGRLFLAMKLVEGRTLSDLLGERPNPKEGLPHFLGVFHQVCQTLAYAHSKSIIHRDLKPLNVMVGAFGEVQVMDWGMARRLPASRTSPPADASSVPRPATTPRASTQEETVTFHEPDSLATRVAAPSDTDLQDTAPEEERMTRGGDVMGTPSYMPPEQACGQVDLLDERSDVFGLGAILCAILTGDPPYRRRENAPVLAQAQLAALDDAHTRLNDCGADPQIVAIARRCLSPRREDRPADAGVVARQVTDFFETVQRRMETARVETAAATARAEVEIRRRKLSQLLTKVIVLAVLVAAFAGSWYFQDRAARKAAQASQRRQVEGQIVRALDEGKAELQTLHDLLIDPAGYRQIVNQPGTWKQHLAAADARVQEAKSVAATGGVDVDSRLAERIAIFTEIISGSEQQRVFAAETELIRFSVTTGLGSSGERLRSGLAQVSGRFDRTLRSFGFDVSRPDVAEKIRESPLKHALIDSIDFWTTVEADQEKVRRLLEIARAVDPDPWRDRMRDPAQREDSEQLALLAASEQLPVQPPGIVQVLALLLRQAKVDPRPMLHRAISASPQDFGLHYMLGAVSTDRNEAIGACRAALAIRPDAIPAHENLGRLLMREGQHEAAIAEFREVLRLRGGADPVSHSNLGLALYELKRLEDAESHLREALRLNPQYAVARNNLGLVLEGRGRLPDARAEFQQALQVSPDYANARANLTRVQALIDAGVKSEPAGAP